MCTDFSSSGLLTEVVVVVVVAGGGGIVGLGWASSPPFFGPLSDGGGSGLALHTNQGVNRIAEAITANFGGS